jgi:lysophospholipase L1-like esterase
VFTGSSTIARWKSLSEDFPNHKVLNRGFGGCEIVDCTHFADRMILPYEPRMVFLRCGGNDIHNGKTAEQVFADFKDFVACVHAKLPETEILYISQNPTLARWTQKDQEHALNKLVKEFVAKTPRLKYIDVESMVLGDDGKPRAELFVEDKLHFNDAGNKLLAEHVRPYLSDEK